MNKYDSDQYVAIFNKLPLEIKDVIVASETTDKIVKIGKQHNLQIDQLGVIIDLTLDVVMGIVAAKDFVSELANGAKISLLDAAAISRDIDEVIFKPIKDTMVKTYGDGAPYKPSSSLVKFYEEEEDHPELNKENILKEIEDPTAPVVKKEFTDILIPKKKEITPKPETKHVEITEYHEEISNQKKESALEVKIPPKAIEPEKENVLNSNMELLNKIASMKLAKTFVMPRETEDVNTKIEEQKNAPLQVPIQAPKELPKIVKNIPSNPEKAEVSKLQEIKIEEKPVKITETPIGSPFNLDQKTKELLEKISEELKKGNGDQNIEEKKPITQSETAEIKENLPESYTVDPYREKI